MTKPHIYKYANKRSPRKCWRCAATVQGEYGLPLKIRHDATSPVYAYRGLERRIKALNYLNAVQRRKLSANQRQISRHN